MTIIAILIPAAGASSRMGGPDKLLQLTGDTPLLARVTRRAVATGQPVTVTVPDLTHPRADLARTEGATLIAISDWASGMAASIRTGVAALPAQAGAVMILPADMPDLQTDDLQSLIRAAQAAPKAIIRATTQGGSPGHPVIFPADLFAELRVISGDQGARAVIGAHPERLRPVTLPGTRARVDLDTPEDWADWKAAQAKQ